MIAKPHVPLVSLFICFFILLIIINQNTSLTRPSEANLPGPLDPSPKSPSLTPAMDEMNMSPPSSNTNMTMMQMTFFWGKDVDILFSGWPGHRLGTYLLALFFVFALSVTVEWVTTFRFTKLGANHVWAGLGQTGVHVLRVGLAYMVMLAVMSFNAGVLIVALVGHAVGFLLFATSLLKRPDSDEPGPDLK